MRNPLISLSLLVLVLISGACAGRQVRTPSYAAPPMAQLAVKTAPASQEAPAADVQAPADAAELRTVVQAQIDEYVAREIAEHDAAVRAAAERRHPYAVPRSARNDAEIVGALKIDMSRVRALDEGVRSGFTALWARLDALERADRGRPSVARQRSKRPAQAAVTAAAPVHVSPAASGPVIVAEPSAPIEAPASAVTAAAPPSPTVAPPPAAVVDTGALIVDRDIPRTYFAGVIVAFAIGLLLGAFLAWRSRRRLWPPPVTADDVASRAHGIILHEVVAGRVTHTHFIELEPPTPAPQAQTAPVDEAALEQRWYDTPPVTENVYDTSAVERLPDAPSTEEVAPAPPAVIPLPGLPPPLAAVTPPHPPPEPLAAGSGGILTSEVEGGFVSGETDVTPTSTPRRVTQPKIIVVDSFFDPATN